MQNAQVAQFFEMVKNDRSIVAAIATAGSEDAAVDKAVQIASERGIRFTAEEFRSFMAQSKPAAPASRELSARELDSVAGGVAWSRLCLGSTNIYCYIYAYSH